MMDIRDYNRQAWNREVERGNRWTVPVTSQEVAAARAGRWQVVLTPTKAVPRDWFPAEIRETDILCLASGGGQQGPILSAAGARVTVLDASEGQLGQDRMVAERDHLDLTTVQGDMADLSMFPDASFDLIFHPMSNLFVPDVAPVWREAFRVLRAGGALLAGVANPAEFIFADPWLKSGTLEVKYKLPFSEPTDLEPEMRQRYLDNQEPLVFGHTLEQQIGAQLTAGFVLTGLYEDGDPDQALFRHMPTAIATRALKLGR